MQRKSNNRSKVIETTSSTVFPITNVTVNKDNIWNANNDLMNSNFDEVYDKVVHWRKSLILLPSRSKNKRFIEEKTYKSWIFR